MFLQMTNMCDICLILTFRRDIFPLLLQSTANTGCIAHQSDRLFIILIQPYLDQRDMHVFFGKHQLQEAKFG